MNVGRISRASNMYNVNNINRTDPAGSPNAANRVNEVRKVGDALVSPEREIRRSDDYLAALFSNSDGDTAEISNNAMDLWRNMPKAAGEAPMPQDSLRPTIGLPFDHQFDLPSPYPDWNQIINNTNTPPVVQNKIPANAPPPDSAAPNITPPDIAAPGKKEPAIGLPGTDTSSFEVNPMEPRGECKTCESRRYIDRSDDSSVSFQTPTKISPNRAASAVAAHENEHVSHEKGKAQRNDREIVNQTVTFKYAICPECGRSYVAGGTTHTTSVSKPEKSDESQQSEPKKTA